MDELLTHDQILAARKLPFQIVDVPGWGGKVKVQGLSGTDRDEYFASQTVTRGKQVIQDVSNVTAKLVARCIVDEDGNKLFTPQEVAALGELDGASLNRVFEVAARLSGITDESMEELGKDSASTLNGASTSSSPVISESPPSATS